MRIRYVISTMIFWRRENKLSFEQECEFIRSMGFGIELWPYIKGQNECRYDRRNRDRLAAATEGMLVSMRSRDDAPTLEQWQEQIECARQLDANIVTDLRSFGVPEGADVDGSEFSAEIVRMAEENGVKLCLETGNLKQIKQLGERFDSIRYCLDTGHANVDPEFGFGQYVDELAERVSHLHLTDNYGKYDDHEPPGVRGGIARENWAYLLDTLNKYDNDIIGSFEMTPCTPDVMIRHASKFLFDVLSWPNKPEQLSDCSAKYNPA